MVGFAFAINGKLNSAEIYYSRDLFGRLWEKMLQATAVEAVSLADEKKATAPTTGAAVCAFLKIDAEGRSRTLQDRIELFTVDNAQVVFTETRDKEAASGWLEARPGGIILPVEEAFQVGRKLSGQVLVKAGDA